MLHGSRPAGQVHVIRTNVQGTFDSFEEFEESRNETRRAIMECCLAEEIQAFSHKSLKHSNTLVTTLCGHRHSELPGGLVKHEPDATYGFVPDLQPDLNVTQVEPWLFFGSQDLAQDYKIMKELKVTHILNLAYGVENTFSEQFVYRKVPMLDIPEARLTSCLPECFTFISAAHEQGGIVLVHCNAGVSRAPTVILAFLMAGQGLCFDHSMKKLKEAKPAVNPNAGFLHQLKENEKEIKELGKVLLMSPPWVQSPCTQCIKLKKY